MGELPRKRPPDRVCPPVRVRVRIAALRPHALEIWPGMAIFWPFPKKGNRNDEAVKYYTA